MVGDDIDTSASQTEGYSEQISCFSKSRVIAGGSEGILSCVPSLPLSPEMGWLRYLGVPGLWSRGGGGGLWPWCNSLPASIPGATHQIPGLQGGNIQWKMNLASIGRVSSWFAGRSSRAPWGPACQHCPGLWHCHLPRLPAITPLPELPLAMAASAEAGWQQGGHIAGTVGTHGGGRAESVHGGKREAGEKKQSE